jgi:hypothetical protein
MHGELFVFGFKSKNGRSSIAPRKPIGAVLVVVVLLFLPLTASPLRAQDSAAVEYRTKTVFLSNFPSFVDWPANTLPTGQAPFLVCVYGTYSFGLSLAEVARTVTAHERQIEIRWIRKEQELRSCQILFVSQSEQKKYRRSLDAVRDLSVLTVGETPEFLGAGGVVSFPTQRGKIEFDVNLDAAQRAHLKISSRLLALARRVVTGEETGKS